MASTALIDGYINTSMRMLPLYIIDLDRNRCRGANGKGCDAPTISIASQLCTIHATMDPQSVCVKNRKKKHVFHPTLLESNMMPHI